jgi:hypothetical protein
MLVTSSDVASIDTLLNWWECAEYIAEAFVILGCVGEFVAEFTKVRTEDWRHALGKISLLLLIAALGIELGALVRTNNLSGQEIAILNGVAADARTRAANAENKTLQLRAAIADRDLDEKQQREVRESIKAFAGKTVYIRSYPNDSEALRLILEIKAALGPTIHVEDRAGQMLSGGTLVLGIRIDPGIRERAFGEALFTAFKDANLSVEPLSDLGSGEDLSEIEVGINPIGLAKQVQELTSARRLYAPQRSRVASKLLPFAGTKINVFGYSADPEIITLANEFLAACCNKDRGGRWIDSGSSTPLGDIKGILVLVKPDADDRTLKAAQTLFAALQAERLSVAPLKRVSDHRAAAGIVPNVPFSGTLDPDVPITIVIGKLR